MPRPMDARRRAGILVILALGLALRLAWWRTQVFVIENEGAEYARIAENLFSGQGYRGVFGPQTLFPPLYPITIGLTSFLVGNAETAGRVISLVAGLALIGLIYRVARELFGEGIGLVAAGIAAVHPLLVALSVSVYSEGLAVTLVFLAVSLTLVWTRTRSAGSAIAAGAAIALAYLTRIESIAFLAPVAGVMALATWVDTRSLGKALRAGFLPVATGALLALPYVAFLSIESGAFRWNGKDAITDILNTRMQAGMSYPEAARGLDSVPGMGEAYRQGPFLTSDQFTFLRDPSVRPTHAFRRLVAGVPARAGSVLSAIWSADWLGGRPFLLTVLTGLLVSFWWRSTRWGGLAFLGFGILQIALVTTVEFLGSRYLFAVVPFALPWAAAGVWRSVEIGSGWIRRWVPLGRGAAILAPGATVVVLLGLCLRKYPAVQSLGEFRQARDPNLRQAIEWFRGEFGRAGERPVLMSFSLQLGYEIGAAVRYPPFATETRALRFIHESPPEFLAFRGADSVHAPYAPKWLEQGIDQACAAPIFEAAAANGSKVRFWRWTCGPPR